MLALALIVVGLDVGAWAFFGDGVAIGGRLVLGCALVSAGAYAAMVGA